MGNQIHYRAALRYGDIDKVVEDSNSLGGVPEDVASAGFCYLWTEGNFGCDCNRSILLGLEELPCNSCGNKVHLDSLTINGVVYTEGLNDA